MQFSTLQKTVTGIVNQSLQDANPNHVSIYAHEPKVSKISVCLGNLNLSKQPSYS